MTRAMLHPTAEHPITIEPTRGRVVVTVAGVRVAETDRALSLRESTYPVVQYIPLADVDPAVLKRSESSTYCPYKGEAGYYSVVTPDGATHTDLIWEYARPYEAVAAIAGHVAFYPNRAEITVLDA